MCSPLLSPLGSAFKGNRTGLALFSPVAALAAGKKKSQPDRLQTLYGDG